MGGWAGLDAARRELRARGIGLMLDFVPNHTAFDHPWIATHPDRYVLGTEDDYRAAPSDFRRVAAAACVYVACGRDPYFAPWTDVAQLNYFNPETRAAMQDTLRTIAAHCDGVRCDMAMLVAQRGVRTDVAAAAPRRMAAAARGILDHDDPRDSRADLSRRSVLGARRHAPRAGVRLRVRQAAARLPALARRRRVRPAPPDVPIRATARAWRGFSRTTTSRAAP